MLTSTRLTLLFIALLTLAMMAPPLHADEGRIIIRGPTPIIINAPGHYVLGEHIAPSSGSSIKIDSSQVTLDLNGFTVHNNDNTVINILGGSTDVTIRNGRLRQTNGNSVITYDSGPKIRLRVERVEIELTDGDGIRVSSPGSIEIVGCTIRPIGDGYGIRITAPGTETFRARILDNFVDGSGDEGGIQLIGLEGGEVSHNTVHTTEFGISVSGRGGNLIEANVVGGPHSRGIVVGGDANLVRNNVVRLAEDDGMLVVGSGNRIVGNVVNADEDGIEIGGAFNLLEDNLVEVDRGPGGEDDCAINFLNAGQHAYRNNMLRGGDVAVCGPPNTDAGGNILAK